MICGTCLSLLVLTFGFVCINAIEATYKNVEGHPAGFLSDCPNETLQIPSRSLTAQELKSLSVLVHGRKSSKKIRYNYYQTHLLAKNRFMDWKKKLIVYVGGFWDNPLLYHGMTAEEHYTALGYNVWLLDTFSFSFGEFPVAVRMLRSAGTAAGEMLANLTKAGVLDPKKIEVLGFSMGAHTASFMAKRYYQLTGQKINRITGVDPTGPCYRYHSAEFRLDKSDAEFIDILHTNIDGYGMATPIGHIDYYINGGEYQHGPSTVFGCESRCSHMRAFDIWMEALEYPDKFIAIQCDSVQQARDKNCYDNKPRVTNLLGLNVDRSKEGIFYLATKNVPPYYMAESGLKKENELVSKMFMKFIKMYPS